MALTQRTGQLSTPQNTQYTWLKPLYLTPHFNYVARSITIEHGVNPKKTWGQQTNIQHLRHFYMASWNNLAVNEVPCTRKSRKYAIFLMHGFIFPLMPCLHSVTALNLSVFLTQPLSGVCIYQGVCIYFFNQVWRCAFIRDLNLIYAYQFMLVCNFVKFDLPD